MKREEIIDLLAELIELDVDAARAYQRAIKKVSERMIKDKLVQFQEDHRKHIDLIAAKVLELGGTPPEPVSDFTGVVVSGFISSLSVAGIKGALEEVERNERVTASRYQQASLNDFPVDVSAIVRSNLADEQRHLAFFAEAISSLADD